MRLWWWCRRDDTSGEAAQVHAELDRREVEVRRLGRALREAQRRNHFAELVEAALRRRQGEGL